MPEHIAIAHQMMLADRRVLEHGWVATRLRDGLGSHRHPAVRNDDDQVQQQPEDHHVARWDPAVRDQEHREQEVRRREQHRSDDGVRDPGERQRREEVHDGRQHCSGDREPPSVDPEVLEPVESSAQHIAEQHGEHDQSGDHEHAQGYCLFARRGARKPLPPMPDTLAS